MKIDGANIITGFKEDITLKDMKNLPIKEKIFIYKYIALINKISLVNSNDKFFFIDDLISGISIIQDLISNIFNKEIHKDILEEAKSYMKMLELKFDKYEKDGITDEERDQYKKEIQDYIIKSEIERKVNIKEEKKKMRNSKVVLFKDWIKLKESE